MFIVSKPIYTVYHKQTNKTRRHAMKIGKNLKKIRLSKGLSQLNVAESVGVTKGTISLYESDGRTPTLFVAKKIADVLGCKLDDFFSNEGKEAV